MLVKVSSASSIGLHKSISSAQLVLEILVAEFSSSSDGQRTPCGWLLVVWLGGNLSWISLISFCRSYSCLTILPTADSVVKFRIRYMKLKMQPMAVS